MNTRERFIDYVKNGSEKPYVSLQIGAGAGFDTKLAGKTWNSETAIEDTIRAYEIVGCDPLYNTGLPDVGEVVETLKWTSKFEDKGDERVTERYLDTPYGQIHQKFHERPKIGTVPLHYGLTYEDEQRAFDIVKWYAEEHRKAAPYITGLLSPLVEKVLPHGPLSIQWNIQPFELFGLASVDNLVVLAKINPDEYRKTCDVTRDVNIELIKEVFAAGVDFVFLGGPGAEMMSPQMYEAYLVPDSKAITDVIHQIGGLVYSHICSPIEPFLSKGYYNQFGLDLFETLSPPPVGNVGDLAAARKSIDKDICTRGNIGLDLLLEGSVADVEKATIEIIEATRGYKHMIAASDYLFYDIPLENAQAVVRTVKTYSD